MKEILEKLKSIVVNLEKDHGPILIFALFLREDPLEKWDIVVSASWLNPGDMNAYNTIIDRFRGVLVQADLMQFSRLVILDANDPVVSFLQDSCVITNGHIETLPGDVFSEKFKFTIKSACVLRCQRLSAPPTVL
ncbi:MAG: hypothetical protein HY861_05445 [Chlamydiia bacterium]|nr:hypothetical protein [Chlamydiia bacterium]